MKKETELQTNLKLWNCHFKGFVGYLPWRVSDFQQQRHVWRVEGAAVIWTDCHPQLPFHVHQLKRGRSANCLSSLCLGKITNEMGSEWRAGVLPGPHSSWPGPLDGSGWQHPVRSTSYVQSAGHISASHCYSDQALWPTALQSGCSLLLICSWNVMMLKMTFPTSRLLLHVLSHLFTQAHLNCFFIINFMPLVFLYLKLNDSSIIMSLASSRSNKTPAFWNLCINKK